MSNNVGLYRATIDEALDIKDLESLLASTGALVHRVDQKEGQTVVYFSGEEESLKGSRKTLAERGKFTLDAVSEEELLKLP